MSKHERTINQIIVHCSDSWWGTEAVIAKWHADRGWKRIGYHYIIRNGYRDYKHYRDDLYVAEDDGKIVQTLDWDVTGIHVRGSNSHSIGICLIGKQFFTCKQLQSLQQVVAEIRKEWKRAELRGHYECIAEGDPPKTCPNLDMNALRKLL